jgi:hypothetical protein
MGREYKIKFAVPADYEQTNLLRRLPSPATTESYSYAIEADGFHFVDYLVDREVAAVALQVLLDEALGIADPVEVTNP